MKEEDQEKEKRPRIEGRAVTAAPVEATPAQPVRAQGIPVEPMGSRVPTMAVPDAMRRSAFDMPQMGAGASPGPQARPIPIVATPAAERRPQPGPAQRTARVSLAEAADLASGLDGALGTLGARPAADPLYAQSAKAAAGIRDRLRQFVAGAKPGDTFAMGADEFVHLDRTLTGAHLSQKAADSQPNTIAYIVLGLAVAGVVVALNI